MLQTKKSFSILQLVTKVTQKAYLPFYLPKFALLLFFENNYQNNKNTLLKSKKANFQTL